MNFRDERNDSIVLLHPFLQLNARKHVLWATMKTTGQLPLLKVDHRPLASRSRAGRPRATGRALDILPDAQNPLL
jgi:hypothetical protein